LAEARADDHAPSARQRHLNARKGRVREKKYGKIRTLILPELVAVKASVLLRERSPDRCLTAYPP